MLGKIAIERLAGADIELECLALGARANEAVELQRAKFGKMHIQHETLAAHGLTLGSGLYLMNFFGFGGSNTSIILEHRA